jgi:uncharacterized SAM-binding protein YcdF (DUF218 family)
VGKAWRGRNGSLLLGLVLLAALVTSVASFARRTQPTFVPGSAPLPGVVFTGQFNRVHAGLALLERGTIGPLLVSGTNPPAGIPLAGFAQQFRLSPTLQAALANGTLVLDPHAANTLQNATQTRQWLATQPTGQAVVLITSRFHMPRASLALEQALGNRLVLRYTVPEEHLRYTTVAVEWGKFVVSGLAFHLAR